MQIYTDVGGRPGKDCGGFCRFCFYQNVDHNRLGSMKIGCVNCPPQHIGCEKCHALVNRVNNYFKSLPEVFMDLNRQIFMGGLRPDKVKVVIGAGADIFFYPQLMELVSTIKGSDTPLHLGYTCGKAIKGISTAEELITMGLDELSFSVFSTDPELRKKWMGDRNPEESVKALKMFCESIDVNASVVAIPGINDEEQIFQTACDLEEWGVKSFVLRRFANFKDQGLILNNEQPLLEGVVPQTYEDFQKLVEKVYDEFSFKILAFPFYDPGKNFPFAILNGENRRYLKDLPTIQSEATVITGKLAGPFLKEFFTRVDESCMVNVVALKKEIADLITLEDLDSVSLGEVKKKVVIPYGALVHDRQAMKILSKDGISRKIVRGPKVLTHPYYEELNFSQEELIDYELKSFRSLIDKINHG